MVSCVDLPQMSTVAQRSDVVPPPGVCGDETAYRDATITRRPHAPDQALTRHLQQITHHARREVV